VYRVTWTNSHSVMIYFRPRSEFYAYVGSA